MKTEKVKKTQSFRSVKLFRSVCRFSFKACGRFPQLQTGAEHDSRIRQVKTNSGEECLLQRAFLLPFERRKTQLS